nr:MATE family efflux transporter [uncultured Acetatifactor sp.]
MTMFISLYGIMDGVFVSNFADKTSFAAISFILPFVSAVSAFGYMLGTGGAALIAKTLGEQQREKADQLFSLLILFTVMIGVAMTAVGLLMIRPAAIMMGATGGLLEKSVLYGRIMISCQTAVMLQTVFQSLLPAAEKPTMGLVLTVTAGSGSAGFYRGSPVLHTAETKVSLRMIG